MVEKPKVALSGRCGHGAGSCPASKASNPRLGRTTRRVGFAVVQFDAKAQCAHALIQRFVGSALRQLQIGNQHELLALKMEIAEPDPRVVQVEVRAALDAEYVEQRAQPVAGPARARNRRASRPVSRMARANRLAMWVCRPELPRT
jgi:hypothetical protein